MTNQPECTVIVPTYNREQLLRHTLRSLARQRLPQDQFEVIVVDDGSTDGTPDVVDSFRERLDLRYLRLEHEGFWVARARNQGIAHARGEVCVFVDSGVLMQSGSLAAHVASHRTSADPVAVCGYVYCYDVRGDDSDLINGTLDFADPDATIRMLMADGRWPDVREEFYARYTDEIDLLPAPWLVYWTVNCSARTRQLRSVGMFDEAFRSWGAEDLDLGYRLHRDGARVILNRRASALHMPHRKDFDANVRSAAGNYRYMAKKYGTPIVELLAATPPEQFVELNNIIRDRGLPQ
jgi:glycosyltransferase involved in cell wall biosynthesis